MLEQLVPPRACSCSSGTAGDGDRQLFHWSSCTRAVAPAAPGRLTVTQLGPKNFKKSYTGGANLHNVLVGRRVTPALQVLGSAP